MNSLQISTDTAMNLNKAVALITGGAQGLGRSICESLLKQGTRVVVADINDTAGHKLLSQSRYGDRLKFIHCNVSDKQQLRDTFIAAQQHFGRLDIVCNNAGIGSIDPARARLQVDINLTAVIEGTYHAIELMSKKNGGNGGLVVNVASAAGLNLLKPVPVYTATKQAVVSFTRCFDGLPTLAEDGVRVNCLCPFFFESGLVNEGFLGAGGGMLRKVIEMTGGFIKVEDVVEGFMKCANDPTMNGQAVVISPPNNVFTMKFPKAKL